MVLAGADLTVRGRERLRRLLAGAARILAVILLVIPAADARRQAPSSHPAPPMGVPGSAAVGPATVGRATPTLAAVPPPAGLPVVSYRPAPAGLPADPTPLSTAWPSEGLHPTSPVVAYTAPGGRPVAMLPPAIRRVALTMPIVERRAGWVAVLPPSANRTVAWVPPGPWITVPLRDQLIVERSTHRLSWLRDGALVRSWTVTLGLGSTPTPLGRTFIIGRSALPGRVYGGADVFALGAVPDDPSRVPAGLRGAHIGIHTWYHDRALGKNTTDGCIRLTKTGHQQLLAELTPGTEVVVLESAAP